MARHFFTDPILSTDLDLGKTHIVGVDLSSFLPSLDDPSQGEPISFNCTYRLTNVQGAGNPSALALPMAITRPYNYENDKAYQNCPDPAESGSKQNGTSSQSVSFPEVGKQCEVDVVHQNRTFGIELDDFLPVGFY